MLVLSYIIISDGDAILTSGDTASDTLNRAEVVASIPSRYKFHPSYSHSFGITENYFIFCETPVTMNMFKTVSQLIKGQPLNHVYQYDPDEYVWRISNPYHIYTILIFIG